MDGRIRRAFRLCLVREPKETELRALRRLYAAQREAARADPQAVRDLLAKFSLPPGVAADEFAGWYAVAAALLNLDETITKD